MAPVVLTRLPNVGIQASADGHGIAFVELTPISTAGTAATRRPVDRKLATPTPISATNGNVSGKVRKREKQQAPVPPTATNTTARPVNPRHAAHNTLTAHEATAPMPPPDVGSSSNELPPSLSKQDVRGVMEKVQQQIVKSCTSRHPGANRAATFRIRVEPSGAVSAVLPIKEERQSVAHCVAGILKQIKFNATLNGGVFRYPFILPTVSKQEVKRRMQKAQYALGVCKEAHFDTGMVVLSIEVEPGGSIKEVHVDSAPNRSLGHCAAEAIKRIKFPETPRGLSFRYPYKF